MRNPFKDITSEDVLTRNSITNEVSGTQRDFNKSINRRVNNLVLDIEEIENKLERFFEVYNGLVDTLGNVITAEHKKIDAKKKKYLKKVLKANKNKNK